MYLCTQNDYTMKIRWLFTLIFASSILSLFPSNYSISSDILLLNKALDSRTEYEGVKRTRIDSLMRALYLSDDPYNIYKNIYEEYKSYNYDTALIYAHLMQEEAREKGDEHSMVDACIANAFVYLSGGLFKEAYDILAPMENAYANLPNLYYLTYARLLWDMADYAGGEKCNAYNAQAKQYIEHIINRSSPADSAQYWYPMAAIDLRSGNYVQSIARMQEVLKDTRCSDHDYAIYESSLAFLYYQIGDADRALHHYIRAAIYDIQSCTNETVALRMVAELLFEQGEVDMSERYIRIAMNDAKRYHARHRQVSISQILPIIEQQQNVNYQQQRRIAIILLAVAIILLVMFCIAMIVTMRRNKIINAARTTIQTMNQNLIVANKLKESMLSTLLAGNSRYLASVEQYQQRVKEYASQRRYSDLMSVPKNVDAHLRRVNMNHQLDQTLLELYPNFGEEFNNLLRPEERFELKKNELLNTPMRIFALIRLGITHHDTIAEILDCSINTVYTYKTKTILRSDLSAEAFYEALMQISAFN